MKGINDVWDFVTLYYPKYHQCDTILAADYLSQLVEKDYEEDSGAHEMLIRDYGGDIDNPQIKADYDDCHRDIYERAIEGFIEALNERNVPPPGFHFVSGELLRLPDVEEVKPISMDYKKLVAATFTLDGENKYKGYHNPDIFWNGFAVPYFDKETTIKILEDAGLAYEVRGQHIFTDDDKYYCNKGKHTTQIKVACLYSCGGMDWTWNIVPETN